ncbi:MAG: LysE family translocator [Dermatophilaceae bacterium]|nr:LysE family translocator [Dermatophilaceae bacterium]MBP9917197.1 LysE family translocator [Dermatophilaceae bacterium]
MPTGAHLAAFLGAAAVIVAIPGPSLLFTIGRALTVGRRDALLTVAGNAVGLFLQSAAVAVGLGALIAASSTAYSGIKLAGAAYLVYLGVTAIRRRGDLAAHLTEATPGAKTAAPQPHRSLTQGLIVGLTNPKTIVFLGSLLPQFIAPSAAPTPQILTLGTLFALIAALGDSIWALAASSARSWFALSPARLSRVGATGGTMMVGLGIAAAVSGRPD